MSALLPVLLLAFDSSNRLLVRSADGRFSLPTLGADLESATCDLEALFTLRSKPEVLFSTDEHAVAFCQIEGDAPQDWCFQSLDTLASSPANDTSLQKILPLLEPYLIEIPYLHLGENDFIYRFRPEKERNSAIYAQDEISSGLYQSHLCAAIKELARRHERSATDPVPLDFGAVQYLLPSHFGFCLGVKNAIERAYETLAANPGRRVFMLSELIHNPFVNADLLRRGLRYLQSDKGIPFTIDGKKASGAESETLIWDTLTSEDIVIIPAFGATDEDKRRLVRKGIPVFQYDATCMLVEKVWKAARVYGRENYTVIIHGKAEHEETKATFSNTRRFAPAIIVRNLAETKRLGQIIASHDPEVRQRFYTEFAGKFTPGFDVDRDLERVAVVNQTTLLMNETRAIISYLRDLYAQTFGPDQPEHPARVGGGGRNDTLCYATQVNQDALGRALEQPLDAAFVIGGKNSSNTYQLFRLCEERLGQKAFFIQSEKNILPEGEIEHYVFPAHGPGTGDILEKRRLEFHEKDRPLRILITGGASCPDGLIQQVITRLNQNFPSHSLQSIEQVLARLKQI